MPEAYSVVSPELQADILAMGNRITELTDMVLAERKRYERLRIAVQANMIRSFPELSHDEIDARIAEIENQ